MTPPKLFEVLLGPEDYLGGMDFDTKGGTGNTNKFKVPAGYDGFRVVGTGSTATRVFPGPTSRATIGVSHRCPHLTLENVKVHVPKYALSYGIQTGTESRGTNERKPTNTRLLGCEGIADEGNPATFWMGYQADVTAEDCDFYLMHCVEHGFYPHGWGELGMGLKRVRFHEGPRSECVKGVNRPHGDAYRDAGLQLGWTQADAAGTPWVPDVQVWLEDVIAYGYGGNYGTLGSWRGGAFVTSQGAGVKTFTMRRCLGVNPNDPESLGLGIEDDGRCYDVSTGLPVDVNGGYTIGSVDVEWCAFETTNKPGTTTEPIIRVFNAESLRLKWSAAYGADTKVGIGNLGSVDIQHCNNKLIAHLAKQTGVFDTDYDPIISYTGKPLSEGLVLPDGI